MNHMLGKIVFDDDGNTVDIFKPSQCPYCEKGIDAVIVNSFVLDTNYGVNLFVSMKCPICGEVFVCRYACGDYTGLYHANFPFPVLKIMGGEPTSEEFSDEINELSPMFVKIYNQAFYAEQQGLDEIDGAGYRKSFEFLIKDFALSQKPCDRDSIIKMTLAQCIDYIFDDKEKQIVQRTGWIGNDHTHYERKHENFNISDFKKMINICISKIETVIREKKYLESFNKEEE